MEPRRHPGSSPGQAPALRKRLWLPDQKRARNLTAEYAEHAEIVKRKEKAQAKACGYLSAREKRAGTSPAATLPGEAGSKQ